MSEVKNAALEELAELYRRTDGTMRQCKHARLDVHHCLRTGCYGHGCSRANEILKRAENENAW